MPGENSPLYVMSTCVTAVSSLTYWQITSSTNAGVSWNVKTLSLQIRRSQMHGFYTEHRTPLAGISLSRDLVQHIFGRSAKGCVVVVTPRPQDLASIAKKQWHILTRQVQRERSSTLGSARITEFNNQIAWMQSLTFAARSMEELPQSGVVFTTADDATQNPPTCSTLYLMQEVSQEQFHLMTSWLPKDGVVIVYKSKN